MEIQKKSIIQKSQTPRKTRKTSTQTPIVKEILIFMNFFNAYLGSTICFHFVMGSPVYFHLFLSMGSFTVNFFYLVFPTNFYFTSVRYTEWKFRQAPTPQGNLFCVKILIGSAKSKCESLEVADEVRNCVKSSCRSPVGISKSMIHKIFFHSVPEKKKKSFLKFSCSSLIKIGLNGLGNRSQMSSEKRLSKPQSRKTR